MKAKDTENRIEGLTRHLLGIVEEVQHLGAEARGLELVPRSAADLAAGCNHAHSHACTGADGVAKSPSATASASQAGLAQAAEAVVLPTSASSHTQSSASAGGRAAGNCACAATCTGLGSVESTVVPPLAPSAPAPPAFTLGMLLRPLRAQVERAREFLEEDGRAVHRGITYLDFPGSDRMEKRINFAMFRRGRHAFYQPCRDLVGRALKAKLHKLAEKNRINGSKHKGTKRPKWGD